MPSSVADERRVLGEIIAATADQITKRWLSVVCGEIAAGREVHPAQLRDAMPDYLAALAGLLSAPPRGDSGGESWAHIAREHGVTRVRIGFDVEQLVREFVALRHVIEEVAGARGAFTASSAKSLSDLIDGAIAKSVSAYTERRDYEAREQQAENIAFLVHELRNPLAAAVTAATMLGEHAGPEQRAALAVLERGHHRLVTLIDSVLLTERLEAGKFEPMPVDVRVIDLVCAATAGATTVAEAKGLRFEVRNDPDLTARADLDLTRAALQNLADNAVKYTDRGMVEVSVASDATTWTVHVRDTGPGLSKAELATIFEPFRRGATSKAGTGVGLAIARRSIEAQGGSIGAESPGPGGAHFWFTLPKRG